MKLKNILFTSLLVSGMALSAQAQFVGDALIFSQENNGGTARFKGLGNAKTSLGGDLSSISGNPAGLGFFGQSDISFTLNYNNANNQGSYFGTNTTRNKGRIGIDHAGIVLNFPATQGYSGWQNFNIGISYENTNTFTNNVRYEGINAASSIVSAYSDDISDYGNANFTSDLRDMKLIDQFADAADGYFPITRTHSDKDQISDILTKGFNSRTALAFGANYNNKLYIGANIGFTAFRYDHSNQFSEIGITKNRTAILAENPNSNFADPSHPDYDFVEANYDLLDDYYQLTEGNGVDFKIGAIYKPSVDWNIGATIASPTWYTIDDYTNSYMDVIYSDSNTDWERSFTSPEEETEDRYRLITPWKFSLGLSKFFSRGLLSADIEYVDYSAMKVRTIGNINPSLETDWDQDVKDSYKGAINFRLGGEVLLTHTISGRAGFNYYGNPYKNADNNQYNGSLGLGFKLSNMLYADLAVVHTINTYSVSPYALYEDFWNAPTPVADIKHQRTNAVLTFGAKF